MILEIKVGGMKCQHCVKSIEKELKNIDGLSIYDISLSSGIVKLEIDEVKVSEADIKSKIADLGFDVF